MFNAWFILYHRYTKRMWHDPEGVRRFAADAAWASKNGIRLLIMEDYYRNYPEYTTFWSAKTLREILEVAHDHGIRVLPYTSPATMDVTSDFYKFHGDECANWTRSVFGTETKTFGFISLPDGDPYWKDYRGTELVWVPTDPCTGWYDYYLEICADLLNFGFDGLYMDQFQESTESSRHPEINDRMIEMLKEARRMTKAANPNNIICANVMSRPPEGNKGEEFVRRAKVADYGLTESADSDIGPALKVWIEQTGLSYFIFSHGTYESHARKVALARELGQPLCLFLPTPFDEADSRILRLYEQAI